MATAIASASLPQHSRLNAYPRLESGPCGHSTVELLGIKKLVTNHPPKLRARSMSGHAATIVVEEGLQGYWQHVHFCNSGRENHGYFLPFVLEDSIVGYIHPRFLRHLERFPRVFIVDGGDIGTKGTCKGWVTLHASLRSAKDRTEAVQRVLHVLEHEGLIPGWRNEHFPVASSFGGRPLFTLERAAVPFFGTKAYGVHMNGYVQIGGEKHMWVAKRSATKPDFPSMLDHLVGGGQPAGIGCKENLIKECDEEADIPASLADKAVPVSAVSYEQIIGETFNRYVLFCYDLELPVDFQPVNKDGEVESFELVPVTKVAEIIRTSQRYRPNVALCVIDFLFRHGYIQPDQPGYLPLLHSLRSGECV